MATRQRQDPWSLTIHDGKFQSKIASDSHKYTMVIVNERHTVGAYVHNN